MRALTVPVLGGLVLAAVALVCAAAGPDAPAADREQAVKGNNAFAFDLYGQLRTRDGNLFFSPESISTALALAYAGARGPTAEEMAATLHYTLPPARLHPTMGALLAGLHDAGSGHGCRLDVANALWGEQGHVFLPAYLGLLQKDYGAPLRQVDFRGSTEKARRTINDWVAQHTEDRIKDLLEPGTVKPDTQLVLTNAVYFKGAWDAPFKNGLTRPGPFHVTADEAVSVPLMFQTHEFKYLDAGTFQALEMPYAGKNLAMVVLLPRKTDGLADLEQGLTAERLAGWLDRMRSAEVTVTLPKFKVTSRFDLEEALAALGMKQAFTDAADFSGMDGKKDLALSAVVHKAYVDVNEEGTEAAAATGAVMRPTAAHINPVFRANHPFLFLIRDTHTGGILFLGRLVRPNS